MALVGIGVSRLGRVLSSVRWGAAVRLLAGLASLGGVCLAVGADDSGAARGFPVDGDCGRAGLVTFEARSASDLSRVLDEVWALAGRAGEVPNFAPAYFPPDMPRLDAETRRSVFIRSVAPHILENNRRMREERVVLLRIARQAEALEPLSASDRVILADFCSRYRVNGDLEEALRCDVQGLLRELLRRADEIPLGLAMGQAALESAWGASRLALEENSLFGQFVSAPDGSSSLAGKGAQRSGVPASYRHIGETVEAYFRNINTYAAYEPFRKMRAAMRKTGRPADPLALAHGLLPYSELGEYYVETVKDVIRANKLTAISSAPLSRFNLKFLSSLFHKPGLAVAVHDADCLPGA